MSTAKTTETDSASTGGNNSKASSTSETTVNDTSSSDGKDLLHSLKGHVSFAKQCLGLLQNQMKHAMDTLDILQDQVTKAQSTIDKIERKENKKSISEKGNSVDYIASIDDGTQREVQLHGHHMIVIDSNGQPLYSIDKPGTSYSIPPQHQGGACLCSACTNGGQPVFRSGQDHGCTDKGQQIITIHPGQAVYPIDDKQVASLMGSCKDENDEANVESKAGYSNDGYDCQKKRRCSCPTYVETSPRSEDDENRPESPHGNCSNAGSNATTNAISNSSKSTSPIATQLLQVIDVLQNAGDDERIDSETSSSFTRSLRSSSTSSSMPFTGPVPHPVYTASGTGILAAAGRKTRKQDMSPIKKENQAGRDAERELPELMKVPPPVLAATLEPDFLVVPGNSYFADSPPSTGTPTREKEKWTSSRDDKSSYERRNSKDSQLSGYETASTSLADVKKELVETMRSSSVSSMASEGSSRSPSESSISEKCATRGLDESKDANPLGDKIVRISRRSSQESTVRDKQKDHSAVYSPTTLHKHPDGDSGSLDSEVTGSSSTRRARPSLLNSLVTDAESPNIQSSPISPKRSSTRALKATPLNSQVTMTELNEMRRSQSLEYTSNPGIVRISHATPMTSAVQSNQSKTDTPRLAPTASPAHSNDKITSSRNSCVHNSESKSSDLSLVTTYSVAQIGNDEANPPLSCTSPTKRPNILSRTRQGKKDIPQGIVVLVPTIEDARQLIKSTGGSQANTPVLVPRNVLNQFSANGEAPKSSVDKHVTSALPGKRPHNQDNSASHSGPKRRHNEPMVID
ncbi:flocculation protein FLO11-like [Actinia tenebrosa]|uniref:Flocculation protein FLO11-like n=1 Tax=Actinia tenebrosa TaxID=6105 RepID=A0A6P8ITX8_ACTTE|nr:flocculation protein FLO11-like [Actinia tenebrosa]